MIKLCQRGLIPYVTVCFRLAVTSLSPADNLIGDVLCQPSPATPLHIVQNEVSVFLGTTLIRGRGREGREGFFFFASTGDCRRYASTKNKAVYSLTIDLAMYTNCL